MTVCGCVVFCSQEAFANRIGRDRFVKTETGFANPVKPASIFGFTDETGIAGGLVVASAVKIFNAYTAGVLSRRSRECGVRK